MTHTDVIRVELVRRGVEAACEEMGEALARSAYSVNIKERRDFSCAAFDARGQMVAHAAHIPVHLGAMPASMDAALQVRAAPMWEPGDVFAINDPYRGGTHLPDVTLISPVIAANDGGLVGFVANRAHHADVGGRAPGSLTPGIGDSVSEGCTIPGVMFWRAGERVEDAVALFAANSRTPMERRRDLDAQRAALHRGVLRMQALQARMGAAVFAHDLEGVVAYGRRRMLRALSALPQGVVGRGVDALESDGVTDAPVPIVVSVVAGEHGVRVDLSESANQVEGNLNAPRPVTVSAVLYSLLTATDPTVPPNAGALSAVEVVTRPGSVVDPRWPAQVSGGNVETSQRVVDATLAALAVLAPDQVPASSQGTMNNLMIGFSREGGETASYYETMGGGEGGTPTRPGQSGMQTHMTNTQNTPVEALERAFPLLVERTALRPGSGGAGQHPGGAGIERVLRLTSGSAVVSLLGERRRDGPPGLAGGEAGAPGADAWDPGSGWESVPSKATFYLRTGQRLRLGSPGGGGWGAKPGSGASSITR